MKKEKLITILSGLLHFQNRPLIFKKIHNDSLLTKLWKFTQKGFFNPVSDQKDIINYITSRNMSKTLRASSNLKNETNISTKHTKINASNIKKILDLISFNWNQSKSWFLILDFNKSLKFHTNTAALKNVASKHSTGKKEETEQDWGGLEAFNLITFINDNFDEILEKNSSVLVMFSAYWCPHCSRLKKHFGAAAVMAKKANLSVLFAMFDVTTDPSVADEKGVIGIPTIKYYNKGKFVSTFKGKRTAEDLFEFVKNPSALSTDVKKADI